MERATNKNAALTEVRKEISLAEGALSRIREWLQRAGDGQLTGAAEVPVSSMHETFEVIQNRKRSYKSADQIEQLKPEDYDLFVDLARGIICCKLAGRSAALAEDVKLTPKELFMLAKLVESQGIYLCDFGLEDADYETAGPADIAKLICLLRGKLKDKGKELIVTGSPEPGAGGGATYCIASKAKVCLVRRVHEAVARKNKTGVGASTQESASIRRVRQ